MPPKSPFQFSERGFSFLIIPTVAALLFRDSIRGRLIFGIAGSLLGMFISILLDGAAIVVSFGYMLGLLGIVRTLNH